MILQALYDYYQRKAVEPESSIAPRGLKWKEIPYLILIDRNGSFLELQDTSEGKGSKREQKNIWLLKVKAGQAVTVGKQQISFGIISDMY